MSTLSALGQRKAEEFRQKLRQVNGALEGAQMFTVEPARAQEIELLRILEGQPFLNLLTNLPKIEMTGDVIYIGDTGLVASRTATTVDGHYRTPKSTHALTKNVYNMTDFEFDVKILYSLIDSWAMFPNFYALWAQMVRRAIANDILRIGFNGTSDSTESNRTTSPQGQDLAKGWLQLVRDFDTYYVDGSSIVLGDSDYPNLDFLVTTVKNLVDPIFQASPSLVAVVGRNLLNFEEQEFARKYGRRAADKSEVLANSQVSTKFGQLTTYSPPYFPSGAVLVTELSNLHRYWQPTSMRRKVEDKPEWNGYADWNSLNMDYAIGDYRGTALVDGITVSTSTIIAE